MTLSSVPAGLLWVAILALCARLLPAEEAPHRPWVDLLLAVLCGMALTLLGGLWTSSFFLPHEPGVISTPDFAEYCGSVAHLNHGEWFRWTPNRSILSGWPAVLATPWVGVVDGLLLGAWVGQALLGAGLFVWGRALHSRTAGIAAALLASTVLPLALLGRTITFYPVMVGALCLTTGLVAVAWRWPGPRTFLLGGAGVALSLLIDLRGLLWGLSLGGLLLLAVLGHARHRDRKTGLTRLAVGLAAASLPVWLAWTEADRVYLPQATTLEDMGNPTKGWERVSHVTSAHNVPMTAERGYIWGRSSPLRIPDTLQFLQDQSQRVPDAVRNHAPGLRRRSQYVDPYLPWAAAGAAMAAIGLLRHPGRLLLLLGTCVPFVAVLRGAIEMRFSHLRFLGNGLVVLPLLMGLGVAVLGGAGKTGRSRTPWRTLAITAVVVAVSLGLLSTDLSPVASWREPIPNIHNNTLMRFVHNGGGQHDWARCQEQINQDQASGQPDWIHHLVPSSWSVTSSKP